MAKKKENPTPEIVEGDVMDVEDITDTPLHMFLSCVVVAQEARPLGLTRKLLQAAAQPYANLPCVGVGPTM